MNEEENKDVAVEEAESSATVPEESAPAESV